MRFGDDWRNRCGRLPGVQGVKRRPAVIVSSDAYHRTRPDIAVGLITSQIPAAPGPTDHILVDWRAAGLQKLSAFRSFFATLPQAAASATIGRPNAADWQAIIECVDASLAR